jgi:signal transduction histidine kinase
MASGAFDKRIDVRSRDEVGELAASFNHMAESLEEQERVRRAFISNLSHDIRSPLTSIRGFLRAVLEGDVPPEKTDYYIGIVMDESERLIRLADNILDYSLTQERSVSLDKTDFDINGLIRRIALSFERRATEKNISLSCRFARETDMVRADAEKIGRVVYNLLDNAVKFIPEGGEITVETRAEGGMLRVCVSDDGPGIAPEELPRVFERFYKGDPSRNEDKKGSGLGLSIVKEIIRAHGGRITAENNPGGGCVFAFTLPKEI